MTTRFIAPFVQALSNVGVPLPGAKLYFYAAGTSTLQNTYSDAALTVPERLALLSATTSTASAPFVDRRAHPSARPDRGGDRALLDEYAGRFRLGGFERWKDPAAATAY